jgi:hypothetical protein
MSKETDEIQRRRAVMVLYPPDLIRVLGLPADVSIATVHADIDAAVHVVLRSARFAPIPWAADPPRLPIDTTWEDDQDEPSD